MVKAVSADPQSQANYNEHILPLCHTEGLNVWDRIQEVGKRIELYIRVRQGQREPFSDFLQRLTKTVQIGVTDPEARGVLIESLAFENANLDAKIYLGL